MVEREINDEGEQKEGGRGLRLKVERVDVNEK